MHFAARAIAAPSHDVRGLLGFVPQSRVIGGRL